MAEEYSQAEYQAGYPTGIEKHFWNVARNKLIYKLVAERVSPEDLIIDLGCGPGIVTEYLCEKGYNCRGIEKGWAPVKNKLATLIDTNTELFDLPLERKAKIKLVLLLDVIEHMEERQSFIAKIRNQLPNCEHLIITVPARKELWTAFDDYWGHYLRYDRPTLAAELEASGFKVINNNYFFHWIYFVSLLSKWIGIKKEVEFKSPDRNILLAALHRVLAWVSQIDNSLIPGFVLGSSIVCVATTDIRGSDF